jgi:uncharacterized protein GlcG (DUF336 family)
MPTYGTRLGKTTIVALLAGIAVSAAACSDSTPTGLSRAQNPLGPVGTRLPTWAELKAALIQARSTPNGGFNLDMWGSVVDRAGHVTAVAFTGPTVNDQWLGSRVISMQKANTANAFSLPKLALSTANLYAATQPGGTLFGLQESNPVNEDDAYAGSMADYGTVGDPMVGKKIGGINVFGGGLALYGSDGTFLGAVGVSGDASCADHNIAWKLRHILMLDYVPAGVADGGKDDNIIYDISVDNRSESGFGHPTCSPAATAISEQLPQTYPIRTGTGR